MTTCISLRLIAQHPSNPGPPKALNLWHFSPHRGANHCLRSFYMQNQVQLVIRVNSLQYIGINDQQFPNNEFSYRVKALIHICNQLFTLPAIMNCFLLCVDVAYTTSVYLTVLVKIGQLTYFYFYHSRRGSAGRGYFSSFQLFVESNF